MSLADDLDSQFLSPAKSPSRQAFTKRISSSSLRSAAATDDDTVNGRFSLAHELAVALMPEPSVGSSLLAEEFGIEYDEGAEGIDGDSCVLGSHPSHSPDRHPPTPDLEIDNSNSLTAYNDVSSPQLTDGILDDIDSSHSGPSSDNLFSVEQDAMSVLAENLRSTDNFISHLRQLDSGSTMTSLHHEPTLEKAAGDIIRHINDFARDREGQLRELLECERELRRIAGEVGGSEALGYLDALEDIASDVITPPEVSQQGRHERTVSEAADEHPPTPSSPTSPTSRRSHVSDFAPQLSTLRSSTTSLVSSLAIISDQAQVNSAATADAGRKIRALKNKLGGWRAEWDLAEQSRLRIERWEVGVMDDELATTATGVRIDGRKIVKEHLQAFELALKEAGRKTAAIIAKS